MCTRRERSIIKPSRRGDGVTGTVGRDAPEHGASMRDASPSPETRDAQHRLQTVLVLEEVVLIVPSVRYGSMLESGMCECRNSS